MCSTFKPSANFCVGKYATLRIFFVILFNRFHTWFLAANDIFVSSFFFGNSLKRYFSKNTNNNSSRLKLELKETAKKQMHILDPCQTCMIEFLAKLLVVNYFCKKDSLKMFAWVLNTHLTRIRSTGFSE